MSEDEALKKGLSALAELTKELREQKLKASGVPPWIPVAVAILVPIVGLIVWFSRLESRITEGDRMHAAVIKRLDDTDASSERSRMKHQEQIDAQRRDFELHIKDTNKRFWRIERKLDLPDWQ